LASSLEKSEIHDRIYGYAQGAPMQNIIIRQDQPADAAQCIEFMQTLSAEPGIGIGLSAGEFILTEAQEAQFIAD
jgi:hypothetical protein